MMMIVFFLHYMFIYVLSSLKGTDSQEVRSSHLGFIVDRPSVPIAESFVSRECSVNVLWMNGWVMNDCPYLGLPMYNQSVHSGMKLDTDKHCPLGLTCRLSAQLHLPAHPLRVREKAVPLRRRSPSLSPLQYAQGPLTFNSNAICLFLPELKLPTNVTRLHFSLPT